MKSRYRNHYDEQNILAIEEQVKGQIIRFNDKLNVKTMNFWDRLCFLFTKKIKGRIYK